MEEDSILEDSCYRREFLSGGFYEDERSQVENDKVRSAFLAGWMMFSVFTGTMVAGGAVSRKYSADIDFEDYSGESSELEVEFYSEGDLEKTERSSINGVETDLEPGEYTLHISDSDSFTLREIDLEHNEEYEFSLEDL